jgi:hypothetical protein
MKIEVWVKMRQFGTYGQVWFLSFYTFCLKNKLIGGFSLNHK